MPNSNLKSPMAIVFDLGGVLIDWNPHHLYQKMFNGDQDKIEHFLSTICPPEWNAKLDAGYSLSTAIEEQILLFPAFEEYIRAYGARWSEMIGGQIDGTVEILAELKEQSYPLFVLSNWSGETYPYVYQRFEFLKWFDFVMLSGEEKVVKPDPAIFTRLLNRIKYPAEQCLFIDDSAPNIQTADQLGFQTIHFTSSKDLLMELEERQIKV